MSLFKTNAENVSFFSKDLKKTTLFTNSDNASFIQLIIIVKTRHYRTSEIYNI